LSMMSISSLFLLWSKSVLPKVLLMNRISQSQNYNTQNSHINSIKIIIGYKYSMLAFLIIPDSEHWWQNKSNCSNKHIL
jgi:hypothetical protein